LVAITNTDNKNSIKLLEKLGFTYEQKINPFKDGKELFLFTKEL